MLIFLRIVKPVYVMMFSYCLRCYINPNSIILAHHENSVKDLSPADAQYFILSALSRLFLLYRWVNMVITCDCWSLKEYTYCSNKAWPPVSEHKNILSVGINKNINHAKANRSTRWYPIQSISITPCKAVSYCDLRKGRFLLLSLAKLICNELSSLALTAQP